MLIRGLVNQFAHLGKDFTVECPVGSGRQLNLLEVSQEIARRLSRLFIRNKEGRRPAQGSHSKWNDEYWRDHILFYEYFHGDTGVGIGASHQTGWTGVIAFLMQGFTAVEAEEVLEKGMGAVTEGSAEVAREAAQPEAVQIAEEAHEQLSEKVVAQVVEAVQQQVAETIQGAQAELQEKVEQIVMEKVAEAVQKKAEEVQQQNGQGTEEKKDIL
jgi:hypothetical protein